MAALHPPLTSHGSQVLLSLPQLLQGRSGARWDLTLKTPAKKPPDFGEGRGEKVSVEEDHVPLFLLHGRITPTPEGGIAAMELS